MAVDLTKLSFYSLLNYLKRALVGSETLTLGAGGSEVSHTVSHSVGEIPFVAVGANLNDTNIIWSNNRVHEWLLSSNTGADDPVQLRYWVTTTQLKITIVNGTGSLSQSGNRTVYWVIYLKSYGS